MRATKSSLFCRFQTAPQPSPGSSSTAVVRLICFRVLTGRQAEAPCKWLGIGLASSFKHAILSFTCVAKRALLRCDYDLEQTHGVRRSIARDVVAETDRRQRNY